MMKMKMMTMMKMIKTVEKKVTKMYVYACALYYRNLHNVCYPVVKNIV